MGTGVNYVLQLSRDVIKIKSKLSVINCKECPYKLPAGVWGKIRAKWPDLQYGDVYSYQIESPCTLPFYINNL